MTGVPDRAPLRSEIGPDETGRLNYVGDHYRIGEDTGSLVKRISAHLATMYPECRFSIRRQTYAGGRSVNVEIVDGPAEIAQEAVGEAFLKQVRDQIARFNRESYHIHDDGMSISFHHRETIARSVHSNAAAAVGTRIVATMTVSEFKRTIKPGDRITLEETNIDFQKPSIGMPKTVKSVHSAYFRDEDGVYYNFQKAAVFACDGTRYRINDGSQGRPDAYRIYRWERTPA